MRSTIAAPMRRATAAFWSSVQLRACSRSSKRPTSSQRLSRIVQVSPSAKSLGVFGGWLRSIRITGSGSSAGTAAAAGVAGFCALGAANASLPALAGAPNGLSPPNGSCAKAGENPNAQASVRTILRVRLKGTGFIIIGVLAWLCSLTEPKLCACTKLIL